MAVRCRYASAAWPWAAGCAAWSRCRSRRSALASSCSISSIGVTVELDSCAWFAVVAVVALFAVLVAGEGGWRGQRDRGRVDRGGVAIAAAVVYCVLRFDARTMPGYVIAAALVTTAEEAALDGTAGGWIGFAIVAAVTLALGYAVTRYIDSSRCPCASAARNPRARRRRARAVGSRAAVRPTPPGDAPAGCLS